MKFVFVLALGFGLIGTRSVADESVAEVYSDLLIQLSRHAGTLESCGIRADYASLEAFVVRISEYRYPGVLGIRARSNYHDELLRRALNEFSAQAISRCGSAIEVSTSQLLVQQISMTLERELPE